MLVRLGLFGGDWKFYEVLHKAAKSQTPSTHKDMQLHLGHIRPSTSTTVITSQPRSTVLVQ